jgi:class 3 adenylate cyclase/HD superfamily phosphodiesterase
MYHSTRRGILLAGSDDGLMLLKADGIIESVETGILMEDITDIAESADGLLWLSSREGTVYRSSRGLGEHNELEFISYSPEKILGKKGSIIDLIQVDGQIYFSGLEGTFRYHSQEDHFFRDATLPIPDVNGLYRISHMTMDDKRNYWMNLHFPYESRNETYVAVFKGGTEFEVHKIQHPGLKKQNINCIYPEENMILWIGFESGILRYDPSLSSKIKPVFKTHINEVAFLEDSSYDYDFIGSAAFSEMHKNDKITIPHHKNRIRFDFLSTNFEADPQFQYCLTGYQDQWSDWNEHATIEFSRLRKGSYNFRVRSRSISGMVSETDSFSFMIKSPLYIAWYAILFYILLLLFLLILYQKWRAIQLGKVQFRQEEIVQERTEALIKEKEKTDELLANILPKKTADELKSKGKATSSKFNMVTVLFADIEGFTKIAEQMNPDKLIDELDHFYFQFDSVVEKYNIEKIKTIGDAYMAAGGIPVKNRTNPVEVILAALEMQHFMKDLKSSRADIWDLRIGIHTGSVIAGVVGQKKFSYDIWGDTVNTASRMESSGEIGKVNISASTYQLVKEFFQCKFRGKMPVKYKGDIAMYFVEGLNPELAENDGVTPNSKFLTEIQLLRLLDLEDFVKEKLNKELSDNLFYHDIRHTGQVYRQVELLGRGEDVSHEDMLLLRSAALLHDMGYIDTFDNHEERSVEYARDILPVYRYSDEQIDMICDLIRATKMPPEPSNLLEMIICDANLDHLGRVDFLIQSDRLFQEYLLEKKFKTKKDWNLYQIEFIEKHEFFTETARKLREISGKQQIENIRQFS